MCGIVGAFGPAGTEQRWVSAAGDELRHRGPDGGAIWFDAPMGVALGHRRLAIQDLSDAGLQPMASHSGRYQIVFNGEIYNQHALREQLGPRRWRGHSDTETFLECIEAWSIDGALRATVGMFAFAAFDTAERKLYIARDRLGEKPMYYGYAGANFVFASELKPLRRAPAFDSTVDRSALALFMRHSYVPAPNSIYQSLRKLLPGTWLVITHETLASRTLPTPVAYWSALEAASSGVGAPLDVDDAEAVSLLEKTLGDAVEGQLLSDVPVGAFLSGGVDSSTIVALLRSRTSQPVRTFSIGFSEPEYDESARARAVAQHLGTVHTELIVSANDALGLVPSLATIYDEPFADSSQLPTYMVARMARAHVTVALSGDGGDELFGGYERYGQAHRGWSQLAPFPSGLRRFAAGFARSIPTGAWDVVGNTARPLLPQSLRSVAIGDRIHKSADLVAAPNVADFYRRLMSHWWQEPLVLKAGSAPSAFDQGLPPLGDLTSSMMALDAVSYLPDDILTKVDRAAMAVSLETRVPLLDHRVFELAWRLPMRFKVRDGKAKWLLRQVLHRHVPAALIAGPKRGFAVPLATWLRGPLRDWGESLLGQSRLVEECYLDAALVRRRWSEHLSGARNWHFQLWNVLMFEAWLESQRTAG